VAAIGEGWCFFANAVSYIAVITGLLLMNVEERERSGVERIPLASRGGGISLRGPQHAGARDPDAAGRGQPHRDAVHGVDADLRRRILHGGPRAMGWLMGAAGVGAVAGALLLASRTELKGLGRWLPVTSKGRDAVGRHAGEQRAEGAIP